MDIKLELTQLREVAGRLGSVTRSLETVRTALDSIRDKTIPIWEGSASEQFEGNCGELRTLLVDYRQDLDLSKTVLEQAVAAYEKTESAVTNKVGSLSTDGIF